MKPLIRPPWDATPPVAVRLPVEGAVPVLAVSPAVDGAIACVAAWTQAREIYAVTPDPLATTGLQPLGPFDPPGDLVATEAQLRSHDGAMVPMPIVHQQGIKPDGSNPAMLIGYGAYGIACTGHLIAQQRTAAATATATATATASRSSSASGGSQIEAKYLL